MNNLENFWKKYKKWIIPVALIFILIISIYTYFRSQRTNTLDVWASFWSGIFGTIASVVIAVWIMQRQIREESKNRRKDEESRKKDNVDNTFFNLLNFLFETKNKLLNIEIEDEFCGTTSSLLQNFHTSIKAQVDKFKLKLNKENLTDDNKEIIINEIIYAYSDDLGSFLRLFQQILKYINDNVEEEATKKIT